MITVAEEFCRFGQAVAAETNGFAAEFIDLEPVLGPIEAGHITAVALTHDFEIVDGMIELDASGKRKRRRQRPSAPPWRRERIRNVQQQCRERCIRNTRRLRGAKQIVAIVVR